MTQLHFGLNDAPAHRDLINVDQYLAGLTAFTQKCQTPMTIAVQGDWGTGKTSAMLAVKNQLPDESIWKIEFNTWQYTQFDLGDQLVFSLINTILMELEKQIPDQPVGKPKKIQRVLGQLSSLRGALATGAFEAGKLGANMLIPGLGSLLSSVVESVAESKGDEEQPVASPKPDNSIALISDLRSKLESIVSDLCESTPEELGFQGPQRIVVFIDDLDRLEPERAVLIMEAIKVFLDVPHCVFILAIDFAVVLRGVRKKYGTDFSEEKARAFFDKIIQVPFNLPVGAYAVDQLVEEGLKSIGIATTASDSKTFVSLIEASTGSNPRSIKRLINTFGLIKTIDLGAQSAPDQAAAADIHIFAILCMQTAFPGVFTELVRGLSARDMNEIWDEFMAAIAGDNEQSDEKIEGVLTGVSFPPSWGLHDYQVFRFQEFMSELSQLFAVPGKVDRFHAELFMSALSKAAVTSVGTADTEGMLASTAFRASALSSLDTRVTNAANKSAKSAGMAKVFEESLIAAIGPVQAGATPKYWSYEGARDDRFPATVRGKRFMELYLLKDKLTLRFGKGIPEEVGLRALEQAREEGIHTLPILKTPPQFTLSLTTQAEAKIAARIVGLAYTQAVHAH